MKENESKRTVITHQPTLSPLFIFLPPLLSISLEFKDLLINTRKCIIVQVKVVLKFSFFTYNVSNTNNFISFTNPQLIF